MDRKSKRTEEDDRDYITLPSGHRVPREEFLKIDVATPKPSGPRSGIHSFVDKLPAVQGSIAGTSSRFFQDYQRQRDRELARQSQMDKDEEAAREAREFEEKRLERKRQLDVESAKKREKRQRRKQPKSKCGLDLPVEIVNQIKVDERAATTHSTKTSNPYALNHDQPSAHPDRSRTYPVVHPISEPRITIIEDDE